MKNYSKKAFSLIEISIVILIIGLLIAGISKATDMLAEAKLKSARSLSRSSLVSRLNNLVLWLDVTQAESWPDTKRGGQAYSSATFSDLNPQTPPTVGFKFSGSYTYNENTGSTLPYLTVSSDISSPDVNYANVFDLNSKGFTIFVVANTIQKSDVTAKFTGKIFSYCSIAACTTAGKKIIVEIDDTFKPKLTYPSTTTSGTPATTSISDATATASTATTINDANFFGGDKIDIISVAVNSSNGNIFSLGKYLGKPATAKALNSFDSGVFTLHADARIYEIIVVGEYMEDSMRQKVEKYLFDKYGVPNTATVRVPTSFAAS